MVSVSVSGVPGFPSVTSRRLNAGLFSMPMMSGYGPSVSVAVTAQEDVELPPVDDPAEACVVAVGPVVDPEQALKSPPIATPTLPRTFRREIESTFLVFMMSKGVAKPMPAQYNSAT